MFTGSELLHYNFCGGPASASFCTKKTNKSLGGDTMGSVEHPTVIVEDGILYLLKGLPSAFSSIREIQKTHLVRVLCAKEALGKVHRVYACSDRGFGWTALYARELDSFVGPIGPFRALLTKGEGVGRDEFISVRAVRDYTVMGVLEARNNSLWYGKTKVADLLPHHNVPIVRNSFLGVLDQNLDDEGNVLLECQMVNALGDVGDPYRLFVSLDSALEEEQRIPSL